MTPPRTAQISNLELQKHVVYKADDNYVFKRGHYSTKSYEEASFFVELVVKFQFYVLVFFAILSAVLRKIGILKTFYPLERSEQAHFTELKNTMETIYINKIYRTASSVVNRPVAGVPGVIMRLKDRVSHDYGWTYQ
ncbi:hypothetical protein FO519_003148 [Halicephalobus sp. NKZ332]|nr:hypothetical protein FO519_003148 [Halicephalobus sp. NKZ332]